LFVDLALQVLSFWIGGIVDIDSEKITAAWALLTLLIVASTHGLALAFGFGIFNQRAWMNFAARRSVAQAKRI
jgi:hypothetical protein